MREPVGRHVPSHPPTDRSRAEGNITSLILLLTLTVILKQVVTLNLLSGKIKMA